MRTVHVTGLLWLAVLWLHVTLVGAQDDASRAMARQLGEEGLEAYQASDYLLAERKLDRAYRLFATPTLGLWSARARIKAGHWVEAAERFRDAARASAEVG